MTICPLAAAGALIGPASAGNWQRLQVSYSLRWVVAVVAAIHADTRQPVNCAAAEQVLDRLVRQCQIDQGAGFTFSKADLAKAITPARSTVPMMSPRVVPTAPASATHDAPQAHAPSPAAGPWLSHPELIRRTLVHIRLLRLTTDQAAEQIGVSRNVLADLLCDRGTPTANTRNRTIAWLDTQSPTWLASITPEPSGRDGLPH